MDKEFLENKLRKLPKGFGIDETKLWLKDIPKIENISEIEPFFERNDLTRKEWFALIVILRQKCINLMLQNKEFGNTYEQFVLQRQPKDRYETVFLNEDKSRFLNFKQVQIRKLQLFILTRCEEICLPQNLEMLEIVNAPKLSILHETTSLNDLKYLSLRKTNKLQNFNFIANLGKLRFLSLSLNIRLPELDFLNETLPIVILQLIGTNAIKQQNLINNLSKLKKLKYLSIKANQSELKMLRENLPNCLINE